MNKQVFEMISAVEKYIERIEGMANDANRDLTILEMRLIDTLNDTLNALLDSLPFAR